MNKPLISANECAAALRLLGIISRQIVEQGDVPEHVVDVLNEFTDKLDAMSLHPTGKAYDATLSLVETGLIPGFMSSPPDAAGRALFELIATRAADE